MSERSLMSAVAGLLSASPVSFDQGSLAHVANGGHPASQLITSLLKFLNLLAWHRAPPSFPDSIIYCQTNKQAKSLKLKNMNALTA